MIHVVTWMDRTKFVADGYETLPISSSAGVFTVVIRVKEDTDIPDQELLTPVVHTLWLPDMNIEDDGPFIEVKLKNSEDSSYMGKRKTHNQDSDDSGMPDPPTKKRV